MKLLNVFICRFLPVIGFAILNACSVHQGSAPHKPTPVAQEYLTPSRYGNHSPYKVFGKKYEVLNTSEGFVERGLASWYGKPFHGRKTSSMETYDMYELTAAHKHLPLPTYVEVTNLDNQKKITVKVNDRGPFHGNRVIDLSYAAAKALGFIEKGMANVEIRAIPPYQSLSKSKNPAVSQTTALTLQAGAFRSETGAQQRLEQIQNWMSLNQLSTVESRIQLMDGMHKVLVGPVPAVHYDRVQSAVKSFHGNHTQISQTTCVPNILSTSQTC